MLKLSMYLGRQVCVRLDYGYLEHGLFEHYYGNQYYIVRYDGSRCFFNRKQIRLIEFI